MEGEREGRSKVKGERSKENTNGVTLKVLRRTEGGGRTTEDG